MTQDLSGLSQDPRDVLRARARKLARRPTPPPDPSSLLEVVEFGLSAETYAFESKWVREAHPLRDLTPVPCTPSFVLGMVNVRGRIVTVIDLRQFFGLPLKSLSDLCQVIIIQDGPTEVGVLADTIIGMRSVPALEVQPSLPTLTGLRADFLRGVTGSRLVILDAGKILNDPELVIDEEVEG